MPISYLVRRLAMTVPTLFGVAVFVFVLMRVVPGDPIAMMVVGESTPEDIQNLRVLYGLDRSIPEQFLIFLKQISTGDFGTSITLRQDVLEVILGRLPATLELAFCSILIAITLGLTLGLISVNWRGQWPEMVIDSINAVALSIPEFLWALLLVLLFSVTFQIFPISGRLDPVNATELSTEFYIVESIVTGRFALTRELLQHIALPSFALALPLIAVIARVLKSSLLEAVNQDYVMLARVKGFSKEHVLLRHALPNALLPTITITGVQFTLLIGGTVLVELIFSYPGIGNMLYGAAINRDLPLIQGITITLAVMFILINLLIDLSYAVVNPRVKHA